MKKNGARLLITRVVELFFVAVVVLIVFAARSRTDTLNPTQIENNKPGTSAWTITNPARNGEIQGYASATSINRGDNISLFVSTTDPTFNIDVFRMGWYGGAGARRVTSIPGLTGQ